MLQTESTFLTNLSADTGELVTTARLRPNRRIDWVGLGRELAASLASVGTLLIVLVALGALALSVDAVIGFFESVWVGAQDLAAQALGELYAAIDRVSIRLLP